MNAQLRQVTLAFIIKGNEILLAMKKRVLVLVFGMAMVAN